MKNEILELLAKTLPPTFVYDAVERKQPLGNGFYIKIWAACSNIDINNVQGQKPQIVSLCLDLSSLELYPQIFGGNGGQCIYRKPNLEDSKEKYLAMKSVKIPFRKPQPQPEKVLAAIEKFFKNYFLALKENKEVLMYQNLVNYNEILN